MKTASYLLHPPNQLSSCIAAAIVRDTRGAALSDADRFNCFPATPLVSVTSTIVGELRAVESIWDVERALKTPALPSLFVTPPQENPTMSWGSKEVFAITIGFYPEAWLKLGATPDTNVIPENLSSIIKAFPANQDPEQDWQKLCSALTPIWETARIGSGIPDWPGSDRLSDWSRHLLARVALSTPGRSARTIERRLKRWTGRTMQNLDHHITMEDLHRRTVVDPNASLADLANDAGYADQSHMGRAVRRSTGFSPARLNRLIKTEEPFWCYRLLGERF